MRSGLIRHQHAKLLAFTFILTFWLPVVFVPLICWHLTDPGNRREYLLRYRRITGFVADVCRQGARRVFQPSVSSCSLKNSCKIVSSSTMRTVLRIFTRQLVAGYQVPIT